MARGRHLNVFTKRSCFVPQINEAEPRPPLLNETRAVRETAMAREQFNRRTRVMRSSSWMANATHAARLISVALLSIVVVGCGTFKVERDKFYPADWPDIVGAGEDCRGIEGTFENKGVLVDEKGRRREVWFTDIWPAPAIMTPEHSHPVVKDRIELRACGHVRLALESFTDRGLYSDRTALRLVIRPSRQSARDSEAPVESCAEIRLPGNPYRRGRGGDPPFATGCRKDSFQVTGGWGGGSSTELWFLGLASDGTLLVRLKEIDSLFFFVLTEDAWARFNKVPCCTLGPAQR
jgi:hypothetical protein